MVEPTEFELDSTVIFYHSHSGASRLSALSLLSRARALRTLACSSPLGRRPGGCLPRPEIDISNNISAEPPKDSVLPSFCTRERVHTRICNCKWYFHFKMAISTLLQATDTRAASTPRTATGCPWASRARAKRSSNRRRWLETRRPSKRTTSAWGHSRGKAHGIHPQHGLGFGSPPCRRADADGVDVSTHVTTPSVMRHLRQRERAHRVPNRRTRQSR